MKWQEKLDEMFPDGVRATVDDGSDRVWVFPRFYVLKEGPAPLVQALPPEEIFEQPPGAFYILSVSEWDGDVATLSLDRGRTMVASRNVLPFWKDRLAELRADQDIDFREFRQR